MKKRPNALASSTIIWPRELFRLSVTMFFIITTMQVSHGATLQKHGGGFISLDVKQEKLVDVLQQLSETTGHTFQIDERWNDVPITASVTNQSVQVTLQRILRDFNHFIIYNSNDEIAIMINKPNLASSIGVSSLQNEDQIASMESELVHHKVNMEPNLEPTNDQNHMQQNESPNMETGNTTFDAQTPAPPEIPEDLESDPLSLEEIQPPPVPEGETEIYPESTISDMDGKK